jgi:hypothetical protein
MPGYMWMIVDNKKIILISGSKPQTRQDVAGRYIYCTIPYLKNYRYRNPCNIISDSDDNNWEPLNSRKFRSTRNLLHHS